MVLAGLVGKNQAQGQPWPKATHRIELPCCAIHCNSLNPLCTVLCGGWFLLLALQGATRGSIFPNLGRKTGILDPTLSYGNVEDIEDLLTDSAVRSSH